MSGIISLRILGPNIPSLYIYILFCIHITSIPILPVEVKRPIIVCSGPVEMILVLNKILVL